MQWPMINARKAETHSSHEKKTVLYTTSIKLQQFFLNTLYPAHQKTKFNFRIP